MKQMRLVYNEYFNTLYLANLSEPHQYVLYLMFDSFRSWQKSELNKNSDFLYHNLEDDEHIIDEWLE